MLAVLRVLEGGRPSDEPTADGGGKKLRRAKATRFIAFAVGDESLTPRTSGRFRAHGEKPHILVTM